MQRTFLYSDTSDILRLRHFYASIGNNSRNESFFLKSTIDHLLSELERTRKHSNELAGRNRKLERENDVLMTENKELKTKLSQQHSQSQQFYPRTPKKRKSEFPYADDNDEDAYCSRMGGDASAVRRSMSMPPPETPLGIIGTTAAGQSVVRAGITTAGARQALTVNASGGIKRRRALVPALVKNSRISQSHGDLTGRNNSDEAVDDLLPSVCESPWLFADQMVHGFQKRRNLLKHSCTRCEKTIGFNVIYVKCTRCKEVFHESCRHFAPLPCVRRHNTPKVVGNGNKSAGRPRLGDFCPDSRPMVPPLVIFCTYFLDHCKTYMPYRDLYQIEGNTAEVEAVTKQFLVPNKSYPKLDAFPPAVISACVNKFLMQIRDPLIPYSYGKEICALLDRCLAIDGPILEGFAGIVEDLPVAHMDTLGHLCRHWNRLVANSFGLLTIDALSVPLGPLVFGSARPDCPPLLRHRCVSAMAQLLRLGNDDFWTDTSVRTLTTSSSGGTPIVRNPSQRSARSAVVADGGGTPQQPNFGTLAGAATAAANVKVRHYQQQQLEVDLNATGNGDTSNNWESARNSQQ
ncbi:hypothetical protein niasHS_014110 [Heterodera schachtii]|uniref:Uncharacterized protein n=1 Tax=Heterodera schachtii TaxID=97005 RepID=A0ABD2IK87_HETSC